MHQDALNCIFQTLFASVNMQYRATLNVIKSPMMNYNAGFEALFEKCDLTATHSNVVAQVAIYSMHQQGTFPEFSNKLNLLPLSS